MPSYPVTPPPTHRVPFLALATALALSFLLLAATAPAVSTITVNVDGREIRLPVGSTAKDVLDSGAVRSEPGDLLDATGEILVRGAGEPLVLLRADSRVGAEERVFDDSTFTSCYGADIFEPTSTVTTATPAPVLYTGKGPLEDVETTGTPGADELVVGVLSGKVVSRRVLVEPSPMVVKRYAPERKDKVVALTFDDGPWPGQTEKILAALKKDNVKATFFMLGSLAKKHPKLARRVADSGHQIANHSYSHANLAQARNGVVVREISYGQKALRRATGVTPTWFRAPGGNLSSAAARAVREADLRIVTWSVDPQDWRKPKPGPLARDVIEAVEPGSIILLHDGGGDRSATIKALPWIIHQLERDGYSFVTLDELRKAQKKK